MVLGLITLAATVPLIASSTLSLQKDAQDTRADVSSTRWKEEKSHLHVRASARSPSAHKSIFTSVACVILHEGKLFIQTTETQSQHGAHGYYLRNHEQQQPGSMPAQDYHPFTGYFLSFPDRSFDGLASTISVEPPLLNWIYLEPSSLQLCYGVRTSAETGIPGPFDLIEADRATLPVDQDLDKERGSKESERRLAFDGWEGFLAVETEKTEANGLWELRFDAKDDGLSGRAKSGLRVVEIELVWRSVERPSDTQVSPD